jgi:hypothetical protein
MADKKISERIFDIRTLEYFIANGITSEKDYEKHLKNLPDEEGNYDVVSLTEETDTESES